jgi:hypothetical protein
MIHQRRGVRHSQMPSQGGIAMTPAARSKRDELKSVQPRSRRADSLTPGTSQKFFRCRPMVDCLRKERLYSEKRPRDILFRVIEQILSRRRGAMMIHSPERTQDARAPRPEVYVAIF